MSVAEGRRKTKVSCDRQNCSVSGHSVRMCVIHSQFSKGSFVRFTIDDRCFFVVVVDSFVLH